MAKEDTIVVEGVVLDAQKNVFKVQTCDENQDLSGHVVLAHLSGKLRMNYIKIVPGDRVRVEISPYDLTRGRITYRL